MIEDALRTKLLANTAITDLIGQQMYVLQAPQGTNGSYVVYFIVSENPEYTAHCITDEVIIQYSIFADKYIDARTIAKLIRVELEIFFGDLDENKVTAIHFNGLGVSEREKDSRKAHISYDFKIMLNKQ